MDILRSSWWIPQSLRQNLSAMWVPLKGYSYDPGYSVWKDISGNNNHGTLSGPVWDRTPWGHAPKFDGIDDSILLSSTITLTGPYTAIIIAKRNRSVLADPLFGDVSACKTSYDWDSESLFIRAIHGGVSDDTVPAPSYKHLLISITRYADNKVYASVGTSRKGLFGGVAQAGNHVISKIGVDDVSHYFMGTISFAAIWSRVFSEADVADLYNMLFANLENPSLMDWNFSLDFSKWQNSSYLRLFM